MKIKGASEKQNARTKHRYTMAHNSRTILFFFSYWLACAATVGRGGGGVVDPCPRDGDAGSAVARPGCAGSRTACSRLLTSKLYRYLQHGTT